MQRPRAPGAGITGAASNSLASDVQSSAKPAPQPQASARPKLLIIAGAKRRAPVALLSDRDRYELTRIARSGMTAQQAALRELQRRFAQRAEPREQRP
jgi:hypothetical protein